LKEEPNAVVTVVDLCSCAGWKPEGDV